MEKQIETHNKLLKLFYGGFFTYHKVVLKNVICGLQDPYITRSTTPSSKGNRRWEKITLTQRSLAYDVTMTSHLKHFIRLLETILAFTSFNLVY